MPATVYERTKQIARKRTARLRLKTLDILHESGEMLDRGAAEVS
jgi:hypothetical protein